MILIYVSCYDSGELLAYRLDPAAGTLVPTQALQPGGKLMPMAFSPDRRRLYVARRNDPLQALSFAIDPRSGELSPTGAGPLPHSMANLATDATGRFLFSASFGGDLVALSPIDDNGLVGEALQVLPTRANAHCVLADPGNHFVFATCMGGGVVMQYRFDATTGRIWPNAVPTMEPHAGASPRHLLFGPQARFVYLLNELDAAVDVLAFDADNGTLRTVQTIASLPAGATEKPWASDLHLRPDGRFLYSSERRSNLLSIFEVDAGSGRLSLRGHMPTETQPRGFAITPDGAFLIAAGETSHHLSVYRIDAETGALALTSRIATGQSPNWISPLSLPD